MKHLLSQTIPSTAGMMIKHLPAVYDHRHHIQLWLFADRKTRCQVETALLAQGIQAEVFSACKPLLDFFLRHELIIRHELMLRHEPVSRDEPVSSHEPVSCYKPGNQSGPKVYRLKNETGQIVELSSSDIQQIEVIYPQSPCASPRRFLLEAYPLSAMDERLCFTAASTTVTAQVMAAPHHLWYQVRFHLTGGESEIIPVFAPNYRHRSITGARQLSPTGWIKVFAEDGQSLRDERIITDYEQAYQAVMGAVSSAGWPDQGPCFERLLISIQVPVADEAVGYAEERLSLKEALHEDLYLSLQAWFKHREGKSESARNSQPGQIVPDITHSVTGNYYLEVATGSYAVADWDQTTQVLSAAERPLTLFQVTQELASFAGQPLQAETRTGRKVCARYIQGSDQPVLISGGQHANETSGVVGALRAAHVLAAKPDAHFVISPLENPDGYALHQRLIQDNPHHMHHAARYTALGDDLEYRTKAPWYEKAIRRQALAVSQAQLHINLHGYPSHEWIRPLSGYVPQGFDMWTIPKGFFLIIRHQDSPQWAAYAERFIQALTLKLNDYPAVMAINQRQITLYEQHAGEHGFRMVNQYPCLISAVSDPDVPLQLITEYPDETIYDSEFIAAHEIQMATVLAAYEVHQSLFVWK
ncbi:hypothetical protein VA7868_03833 [Vibrio aerogenes CECT 7868]|uniref:Zinc carboxypeptidase n=1 Tax=Vibrio aerogenes CECT 7868 TaxID=1216006 RepID=A0A1M6BNJ7_9VIBR|nr:M14 family metallopeptidase [Vibrio aerogenes]SHI50299.1 hypothetical protein VA7868_03833 [Vibrio aerogenes CECT 7868]